MNNALSNIAALKKASKSNKDLKEYVDEKVANLQEQIDDKISQTDTLTIICGLSDE